MIETASSATVGQVRELERRGDIKAIERLVGGLGNLETMMDSEALTIALEILNRQPDEGKQ